MKLKKVVAPILAVAFAFGTVVTPTSAKEPEVITPQEPGKTEVGDPEVKSGDPTVVPFDLHAHVFDYGESIDQVQIDFSGVLGDQSIDPKTLDATDFDIVATATDPYAAEGEDNSIYSGPRTITGVSVENGVVTLDLACSYGGANESTLQYTGRNIDVDLSYTVSLTGEVALTDGTVLDKDAISFSQDEIINEETAAFQPGRSNGLNYQLYSPANASDGQEHPLIVWFHGAGEGGTGDIQNNTAQLRANRGALGFTTPEAQEIFGGAYVLAPQAPSGWGSEEMINSASGLIYAIANTYNVDTDRIYVFGCSAGGNMTVRMAIANPDLFAAVVPICGAFGGVSDEDLLTMSDMNLWIVHAENDPTVGVENTSERLHALIPDSIYTPYPTVNVDGVEYPGHWSWIYVARNMPTYNGQSIFEWTAQQTLNPETTSIPFDLHAHVFDYGEAIDAVQIDLSSVLGDKTIDADALTTDTFTVSSTATDPYNSNAVLYEDVSRTVTGVSVENGIVTLSLACEYNGAGQSTLNYSFDAGRNLSADVAYDITLTKDIALSDGSVIAKDGVTFAQKDVVNEETAAFTPGYSDGLNYQLYIPGNAGDGEDHPLIIWFHGGGEGGFGEAQNNTSQLRANRGALGFIEEGTQEIFGGAYVLAPQSPSSWPGEETSIENATALINTIANTYNIDKDRIYVAGCSAGGWMTVNMTIANPDLFAAVVPICGAFGSSTDEELLTMKDNNLWIVHAMNDTTIDPANTSDRLHSLIPSSIYTPYDTVTVDGVDYPGHWSWIYVARNMPTYNGQTIFEWMASQTLATETTAVPFDLHAHVFDYGEAIDAVQIDLSSVLGDKTIDADALTPDMFTVSSTATDPYNSNAVLYEDVSRTVTGVSVENGIVTLSLACEYNGAGQSTLNYSLDAGRNLSANVAYDIALTKDIALSDGSVIAKDAVTFTQQDVVNEETAAFTPGSSDGLNYQLYIPSNAGDGEDHPLIIWFHGGGEGGFGEAQNNTSQLRANRGALGFATPEAQEIFGGAYVLAPQSPNSWSRDGQTSIDNATALINTIANTYNVDKDRIYVAGCSDGGWMTVNMTIANPDLFAAVVPICAAFGSSTDEELLTIKDNNIWLVHAMNDTAVDPENTSERLHALIPSTIYTPYETVNVDGVEYPGHWSWIYVARNMPTYNGQNIFQWMASQTLAEKTDVDTPVTDVEKPGDTQTTTTTVQTGDTQMVYPYVTLMLAALTAMSGYVVVRRQRKEEEAQ